MSRLRSFVLLLLLTAAAVVAGARLAHAQAVNPRFLEFTSLDHNQIGSYRVCFYPSAAATTATRCTDVPVALAASQGNNVYRIARAAWETGLAVNTDFWPKVGGIGTNGIETTLMAVSTAPFFFRLAPRPRDVSDVILVP